ncbi:MAG: hypothetical protein ACRDY7_02730 [Acidimicrobiia bacterium]
MRRLAALLLCVTVLGGACSGDDDEATSAGSAGETSADDRRLPPVKLSASVASYDLAIGPEGRFMVGVFDNERGPVGFGTVDLSFFYFGAQPAEGAQAEPGPSTLATYLPIPGFRSAEPPFDTARPSFLASSERGVYQAKVAFDRPGFWKVQVAAIIDNTPQTAEAAFEVLPEHEVPMPGEPAPRSENLTVSTPGAPPAAIDSRASAEEEIPDPELHQTTVRRAVAEKKPVLLVISTPTFCVSRFCGPITDMVSDLAKQFGDRAAFVHIEVWEDFEAQKLNPAAAEWIAQGKRTTEPWVFFIGPDGNIGNRWDNVVSRTDLELVLSELPSLGV